MRTRRSARQLEPASPASPVDTAEGDASAQQMYPNEEANAGPMSSARGSLAVNVFDGTLAARFAELPVPPTKLSRLVETSGPRTEATMTSEDYDKLRQRAALLGQTSTVTSVGPPAVVSGSGQLNDRKRPSPDTVSLPSSFQHAPEQQQDKADLQPPAKQRKCASLPAVSLQQQEESPFATAAASVVDLPLAHDAKDATDPSANLTRDSSALLVDTHTLGPDFGEGLNFPGAGSGTISGNYATLPALPPAPLPALSIESGSMFGSCAVAPTPTATAPANNLQGSQAMDRSSSMDWALGQEVLTSLENNQGVLEELFDFLGRVQQQ